METQDIEISKLIEYAGNPRKNDHAVDKAAAIIKRFGFRVPVLVKSDFSVIDGHLRLKAARKLGFKTVPCSIVSDMSEAEIKAFRISVNKVADLAEWDEELLRVEFEGLEELEFDLSCIGFDEIEISAITEGQEADVYSDWESDEETPEYDGSPKGEGGTIIVHFPSVEDRETFFSKLDIAPTSGKFCWFPEKP